MDMNSFGGLGWQLLIEVERQRDARRQIHVEPELVDVASVLDRLVLAQQGGVQLWLRPVLELFGQLDRSLVPGIVSE